MIQIKTRPTAFHRPGIVRLSEDRLEAIRDDQVVKSIPIDQIRHVNLSSLGAAHAGQDSDPVYRCLIKGKRGHSIEFRSVRYVAIGNVEALDWDFVLLVSRLHEMLEPYQDRIEFRQGSEYLYWMGWLGVSLALLLLLMIPCLLLVEGGYQAVLRKGWAFSLVPLFLGTSFLPLIDRGRSEPYSPHELPPEHLPLARAIMQAKELERGEQQESEQESAHDVRNDVPAIDEAAQVEEVAGDSRLTDPVECELPKTTEHQLESAHDPSRPPESEMLDVIEIFDRADEQYERGEYEAAIEGFTRVIELDPDSGAPFQRRGHAHFEIGFIDMAIKDYGEFIDRYPKIAQAYVWRGEAHHKNKDYFLAWKDLQSAIKLDPTNAQSHYELGAIMFNRCKYRRAIDYFSKACELNAGDSRAFAGRGHALLRLDRYGEAIADFDIALELNPQDADALANRGHAHCELDQAHRALDDYSAAIKIEPGTAMLHFNRAVVFTEMDDDLRSLGDFDKAIELDPHYVNAYVCRGAACGRLGDYERAIADFSEAVRLDPNNERAWQGLADVESLQTSKSRTPSFPKGEPR
jgi:tetratricopeptide (TPR) repeat protein